MSKENRFPIRYPSSIASFGEEGNPSKEGWVKYVAIRSWQDPPWQRAVTGGIKEPPMRRKVTP